MKRYDDLQELLGSLEEQTCHDFEVVLVIEKSHELFSKMNESLKSRQFRSATIIMNDYCCGLSNARNIGISHSSGANIAFIDDDAVSSSRWVELILAAFDDESICAVTGDVKPLWTGKDQHWFPSELNWIISCSYVLTPTERTEVDRGFGVNMAFRRSTIDTVGMFDTRLGIGANKWLGGEDTEMFLRAKTTGKKVIFDPDISVQHKVSPDRVTLNNLVKRSIAGGYSVALMREICGYGVNQSKESNYLTTLLTKFYPRTVRGLIRGEWGSLRKLVTVSMVIYAELFGFVLGTRDKKKIPAPNPIGSLSPKKTELPKEEPAGI